MKAITVTQDIKNSNPNLFKNYNVDSIRQMNIPKSFVSLNYNAGQRTDGYHTLDNTIHESDGFYDIIIPSYNSSTQKLGNLYFNNNHFTYTVVDKTDAEIQAEIIATSEANKQELIQQKLEENVVSEAQQSDDTNALDNQDLFPMWQVDFDYTIDYKCQAFNDANELKLYKCVQSHTSQSDWQPKDVPALFTVVAYPNEIPVFVQPTGSQDAYQTGDQVYYPDENGSIYESLIDANVWSPTVYPQGWQLIN